MGYYFSLQAWPLGKFSMTRRVCVQHEMNSSAKSGVGTPAYMVGPARMLWPSLPQNCIPFLFVQQCLYLKLCSLVL